MHKLFGRSERLAGCSSTSELRRNPALGLSAVLLVLGMGFGANAWALCDSEVNEAAQENQRSGQIDRRYDGSKNLIESHQESQSSCFKHWATFPNDDQIKREKTLPELRKNLQSIENGTDLMTNRDIRSRNIAVMKYRICALLASIGPCGNNSTSSQNTNSSTSNQSGQPNPLQSQTQRPQQEVEDSRVTGPREDCQAVLNAALNRPDFVAVHMACLSRNVSRERNQKRNADQNTSANPLQSQTQESQQRARDAQVRADAAAQRNGKRVNDPAAQAHECVAIDKAGSGNFGAFKNTCSYPINFVTCNENPKVAPGGFNWSADFDCSKKQFGLHTPGANVSVAAHNRNTEFVYWFACKAPASPVDAEYASGRGISGRCQ